MSEDDRQVMKAALDAGRAVYHADLRYNLGVDLCDAFSYSLSEKEGDLDSAIAEFRGAVRLDSNNALAQYHLCLALSWRDLLARPEKGKFVLGIDRALLSSLSLKGMCQLIRYPSGNLPNRISVKFTGRKLAESQRSKSLLCSRNL